MSIRRIKTTQVAAVRQDFADKQGGRCAVCLQLTPPASQVLDHDHTTGFLRAMLCRNCNGIEGKVKNLARRGQRQFDHLWFLKRLAAYWEEHDHATPEHGLLHPTHKTEDEKRLRRNAAARTRRAALKKG